MVAEPEIVRNREARIRRYVADPRRFSAIDLASFRENRERQYAVLHDLRRSLSLIHI